MATQRLTSSRLRASGERKTTTSPGAGARAGSSQETGRQAPAVEQPIDHDAIAGDERRRHRAARHQDDLGDERAEEESRQHRDEPRGQGAAQGGGRRPA